MTDDLAWLTHFHGFLLVDKAAGMTSQDVITRMQRLLINRSVENSKGVLGIPPPPLKKKHLPKMGHGGTLDPFATGLLVIAVGDGTKLARYLIDSEKTYEADVEFGARTASGDLTNEVVEKTDARPKSQAELLKAAESFLGLTYLQTPPMYSAKKIDGKPLYELARKGLEVDRAVVNCRVVSFEVLGSDSAHEIQWAKIRARVSSGTYIRTLAEDFAKRLGTLAHLRTLRRLATGRAEPALTVENAVTLETLEATADWSTLPAFRPFDTCLLGKLPRVDITDDESRTIIHGLKHVIAEIEPRLPKESPVAIYHGSELRAVFARTETGWDFERVFHPLTGSTSGARGQYD